MAVSDQKSLRLIRINNGVESLLNQIKLLSSPKTQHHASDEI